MSWFNPKAFAAGALKELEDIVDTNIEEAKTYEEEQRELFKTNRKTIDQRRRLVDGYIGVAEQLSDLGASDAQIRAAHSSGLGNLSKLLEDVQTAIKARSGTAKLSKFDVEAMITTGGVVPQVSDQFDDMDYRTFIEKSMNLGESGTPEVDPQLNLFQKAFGSRSKDVVRAKLDREMGSPTMSILDINEAASRSTFESLMPGAYASFSAGPVYDTGKALTLFTTAKRNALKLLEEGGPESPMNVARQADDVAEIKRLQRLALKPFAVSQFNIYGKAAAEDDVLNYKEELGPDIYNELYLQMFGETDGLEDDINELASNKVTLANGVEVITDINEAASRSTFESLMPGAYASFSDGNVYDRGKAYTLFDRVQKNKMREVESSAAYQKAKGNEQFDVMDRLKYDSMKPFAIQQWTLHGKQAAEDAVIDYKKALGPDVYNELYLQMFGETDGLEEGLDDLTSNKVTLGNGVQVITDTSGNISKIILPEKNNSPAVTITDRDGIVSALEKLEELNLLPTDSDTFDEDLTGPVDTDDDAEEEARLAAEVEAKRKAEEEARLAGEADGGADALKAEKLMDDIDSIVKEYPFYQETVEEFLGPDVDLTSTAALRKLANSLSSSISDSGKGNRSARLRLLNAVKELRNIDSGTEDSGEFNALDFAKKYLLGSKLGGDS